MIKLNKIKISHDGKRIIYDYSISPELENYFNKNNPLYIEYDTDISKVPDSIIVIPFLANFIPIAWFSGFSIQVEEVDDVFMIALKNIKKEFEILYPNVDFSRSKIYTNTVVKNNIKGPFKQAILFSGGADAYATFFRHYQKKPDLITIQGADVEIDNSSQWERILQINKEEAILTDYRNLYIKSNLITFYSNEVNQILPSTNWWSTIQHGLALTGILAPLAIINKYNYVYIASSYTEKFKIPWGSTPEIDNKIKWADTTVVHDAYELNRIDKIALIIETSKQIGKTINLRVCYSIFNDKINCGRCEKCCRTIIALTLLNANPNDYGFITSEKIYNNILKIFEHGFKSKGVRYFWSEILQKLKERDVFYVYNDLENEKSLLLKIENQITENLKKEILVDSKIMSLKKKMINKFPKLFKFYVKFRIKNIE
ncbi:hypothetical protein [Hwangdonia seohaensis]|uniref:7-cyano-7-deazaguanine synthase n=1 Tax=Hwangdonia seohaensis TaxID=1240727 RepID=A0ABW3RAU4_9FLAO|nr:hypothetical protein [Hwangdonia seohaensis]